MSQNNRELDQGTGYGRPEPSYNARLTEVGPRTPMGELMRRYWQPFAKSQDATDTPRRVRLLGEDLVLFRDSQGRAGLVVERCCHRGASLFFGRVEEDGIRCCYHGWKFDVKGHCLDQATEVEGGKRRDVARQPWYPVEERYGLIFAYMGPPDQKPVLPRWAPLENLKPGQFLEVSTHPGYGPGEIQDYNWLQSYENVVDSMHAMWLHSAHSGNQFLFESDIMPQLPDFFVSKTKLHGFVLSHQWDMTERGVTSTGNIPAPQGVLRFTVESIFPNAFSVPGMDDMAWIVPVDDTHCMVIQIGVVNKLGSMHQRRALSGGKNWEDTTPEERQRFPSDYEAQQSQGPIAFHSEERLAQSDTGVIMVRRCLNRLLDDLEAGRALMNVSFDDNAPPFTTAAGSVFLSAAK